VTSPWSGSPVQRDAIARIPALHPQVAVLDARLPDGSGIEVCRSVRAVDPTINALILTSYDDDEALFAAIMAGASGNVLKKIKGMDLVSAVRHVAVAGSLVDPRPDRAHTVVSEARQSTNRSPGLNLDGLAGSEQGQRWPLGQLAQMHECFGALRFLELGAVASSELLEALGVVAVPLAQLCRWR